MSFLTLNKINNLVVRTRSSLMLKRLTYESSSLIGVRLLENLLFHILKVTMNKIEPCEMCGRYDGDMKEKWQVRKLEVDKMNLLLAGILFAQNATSRQIELFMAKYYIGRESYSDIGRDFGISKQTVAETIDRSCDIITEIINKLSG